ncbi:hypothetical protein OAV36_01305 [Flavobacteriales bacterium]|jgi:hypothetical protein|nr:hypothetical protein [Flavobacteriales bacterium]
MILSIYVLVRSIFGIVGKVSFSTFHDIKLPIIAVICLYLELILGILLYAIYINKLETLITQANATTYFSARFWALEHAILMMFAIIFGHLGLVYAKNLSDDNQKFKKNLLYFGLSAVLIFISITMNMFRNA